MLPGFQPNAPKTTSSRPVTALSLEPSPGRFCEMIVGMAVRPSTIPAFIVVAAILLASCGESNDADSADWRRADVLKRGNGGEPETLDPALAEDIHAFNVLMDLFQGLVTFDASGSPVPGSAATWVVSNEGLRWTFDLRKDARWSNGEPLVAQHFVDGIRHVVGPGSRSPSAFLLEALENYGGVMNGEVPLSDLGVYALDDFTVRIELARPVPYFASILAMPVAYPRLTDKHSNPASFRDSAKFVGNGAYVLDEWQVGSFIRLKRNDLFHSAADVSIDTVEYLAIENPLSEYNLYRTGELDITATIDSTILADVRAERPYELSISPGLGIYYLAFDLTEAPTNDRELRKALSMAVDRNKLSQLLGRGEVAAFNLVPPGVSGYEPVEYDWKDLTTDKRENASRYAYNAAGYSQDYPLKVTLTYDAGDVHEKIALAVSSMWREVLGADVSLQKLEWKIFLATREQRFEWEIMRFSWFGDFDDPTTFTGLFRSNSLQNLPGYRNSQFDQLLDSADEHGNQADRKRLLSEAERVFLDDYPIIPLYFYVNKHLVKPRVQGYMPNVMDRHPSQTLRLK